MAKIPNDPNLSPEMRAALERIANNQTFSDLIADSVTADTVEADTLTEGGDEVLTVAGNKNLTGGFTSTEYDNGTFSSGTLTPSGLNGFQQKVTNGGAFTIAAPSTTSNIELHIINNASAGAISVSGFSKQWPGDSLDTTSGHEFVMFIYVFGSKKAYLYKALQ